MTSQRWVTDQPANYPPLGLILDQYRSCWCRSTVDSWGIVSIWISTFAHTFAKGFTSPHSGCTEGAITTFALRFVFFLCRDAILNWTDESSWI